MFDLQNGKKHGRGMYACSLGSLESLHEKSDASFFFLQFLVETGGVALRSIETDLRSKENGCRILWMVR